MKRIKLFVAVGVSIVTMTFTGCSKEDSLEKQNETAAPVEATTAESKGTINFCMIDHYGNHIQNAVMEVYSENGEVVATLNTRGAGEDSVELPAGEYTRKIVSVPEGILLNSTVYPVEVEAGELTQVCPWGINATTGTLKVKVVEEDGVTPAFGLPVNVVRHDQIIESVYTDENGEVSIELAAGNYDYWFYTGRPGASDSAITKIAPKQVLEYTLVLDE